jgi:TolA-binding protein
MRLIPGNPGYDFNANLDKVRGGAFMTAFQGLKGGGPITDKEGDAGLAALQMMDPGQSVEQFLANAKAYRDILVKGLEKSLRDANRDIEEMDAYDQQQEINRIREKLMNSGVIGQ